MDTVIPIAFVSRRYGKLHSWRYKSLVEALIAACVEMDVGLAIPVEISMGSRVLADREMILQIWRSTPAFEEDYDGFVGALKLAADRIMRQPCEEE